MENQKEKQQENKSCVEQFLEYVYDPEFDEYLIVSCEDWFDTHNSIWFRGFCKELKILLEKSKVTDEYVAHLKTKNEYGDNK